MPFQPGHKLAVGGRKEKPFRDALRLEIAAVGQDQKALREIARGLIALARDKDLAAILALRDTLDGKPMQESSVTVEHKTVRELTDVELDELLAEATGIGEETPPLDPSQLN